MAIWMIRHPMDPTRPTVYRVEHHKGNTIAVLGLLPDVAPHHRSLDPFLSALVRARSGGPAGPGRRGARTLGRGLAVIRICFGVIFLANGLAKVFGWSRVALGDYYIANLINWPESRRILDSLANTDRPGTAQLPGIRWVANELVLDNWGVMQWVTTAMEVGVGLLLVVGLASRRAALVGLGFQLFLAAFYLTTNKWMFEQPHEYVPLTVLAVVASGAVWGLDGRLRRGRTAFRRWPFSQVCA